MICSTHADPAGDRHFRRYRTSASCRVRRRGTPRTCAARAGPSASCRRCPRRRRPARSFPHPVNETRRQSNRPYENKKMNLRHPRARISSRASAASRAACRTRPLR